MEYIYLSPTYGLDIFISTPYIWVACGKQTKDKHKEIIFIFVFCRFTIDPYTIYINYLFSLSNKMYSCKIRGILTLIEIYIPFKSRIFSYSAKFPVLRKIKTKLTGNLTIKKILTFRMLAKFKITLQNTPEFPF